MTEAHHNKTPEADDICYDNAVSGLSAEDVQAAIDEISTTAAVSASPGFTWGTSGNVPAGTYLLNDSVPSNTAGRLVPVNGQIEVIFVACEIDTTATIEIQRRVGAVFTTLTSSTLATVRKKTDILVVKPAVSKNDELAVKITGASIKNPVVGIIIKGSL